MASMFGQRAADSVIVALVVVLVIVLVGQVCVAKWRKDTFTLERTRLVESRVDGQKYRVHPGHEDPHAAADEMAWLNDQMVEFMRVMRRKYGQDDPATERQYPRRCRATRRLLALYNPDNLAENSPRDPEGDTSYVLDKGAIFAICLREKGREGLLPRDILMFVALHELTHIAIEEVDHPPEFWAMFRVMLREAAAAGLIQPTNYAHRPIDYCGLKVDYNPYFDASLPEVR
jgi:hypothetical protein